MEAGDIEAVVDGFANAARLAAEAGCDGVEINAGQHSLVRQFLSGLTNQRDDEWGRERNAVRATGDRRGARRHARRRSSGCVCRATSSRRGPASRRSRRRPIAADLVRFWRRLPRRGARLDLLVREDPTRLPRADRVQHRTVPNDPGRGRGAGRPPRLGGRRRPGRVGARRRRGSGRRRVRRGRDDAGPDRRPANSWPRSGVTRPTRSGRASAATRHARSATSATRSSPVSASRRAAARPKTRTGTRPLPRQRGSSCSEVVRRAWRRLESRPRAGTRSSSSSGHRVWAASRPSPARTVRSSSGSNARSDDAA